MTSQQRRDYLELLYGSPLQALSDSLRGFIVAKEGHDLVAADFANIEGRVLAWLAGEEWKIQAFTDFDNKRGPDLYKLSASRIFHLPVDQITDSQRQIGKVAELALGYQGGVGAFQTMAKGYNVKVKEKQADEIKNAWRDAHPKIVRYWYELERISRTSVLEPGKVYFAGSQQRSIKYRKAGSFLLCQLPSRRCISYPYPEIREVETPWGEKKEALTYMGVVNNQWVRCTAYGGLLAENITQAVARDVLAEALQRLDEEGYQIALHVHDAVVAEIPSVSPENTLTSFIEAMCAHPVWAEGLPIKAEGYRGKRFKK